MCRRKNIIFLNFLLIYIRNIFNLKKKKNVKKLKNLIINLMLLFYIDIAYIFFKREKSIMNRLL